jgi:hypothetical protein
MCNCGKKRREYSQPNVSVSNTAKSNMANTNFQYTGRTALTVTGNITGKNYRFNYPGQIQTIDHRDAFAMKTIPMLKKLNQN